MKRCSSPPWSRSEPGQSGTLRQRQRCAQGDSGRQVPLKKDQDDFVYPFFCLSRIDFDGYIARQEPQAGRRHRWEEQAGLQCKRSQTQTSRRLNGRWLTSENVLLQLKKQLVPGWNWVISMMTVWWWMIMDDDNWVELHNYDIGDHFKDHSPILSMMLFDDMCRAHFCKSFLPMHCNDECVIWWYDDSVIMVNTRIEYDMMKMINT